MLTGSQARRTATSPMPTSAGSPRASFGHPLDLSSRHATSPPTSNAPLGRQPHTTTMTTLPQPRPRSPTLTTTTPSRLPRQQRRQASRIQHHGHHLDPHADHDCRRGATTRRRRWRCRSAGGARGGMPPSSKAAFQPHAALLDPL